MIDMTPPQVTRMWTTIGFARNSSFSAMVIGHQQWSDCLVLLCPSPWSGAGLFLEVCLLIVFVLLLDFSLLFS